MRNIKLVNIKYPNKYFVIFKGLILILKLSQRRGIIFCKNTEGVFNTLIALNTPSVFVLFFNYFFDIAAIMSFGASVVPLNHVTLPFTTLN